MLKIGGHNYKLISAKLGDNELGETNYNTATITIDSTITEQSIKEATLFHEFVHTCNSTFGYEGMEHAYVDSLAEQLYQIFKDNGLLNEERLYELLNPKT